MHSKTSNLQLVLPMIYFKTTAEVQQKERKKKERYVFLSDPSSDE